MNLVGKIFIMLIFVMSLVFMTFAVAVYSTHQNWREAVERPPDQVGPTKPLGLKYALQNAQKANEDLQNQLTALQAEVDRDNKAKKEVLAKLEAEKDRLSKLSKDLDEKYTKLNETHKIAVAMLDTASQTLKSLTEEVTDLRQEIRNTQQDRDKQFQSLVKVTDQVHQTQGDVRRLEERRVQLAAQVARAREVLKAHDLTEFTTPIPPRVIGKVVAVNRDDMVEVDLGADDGIRRGVTLEVFRGSKYLGKVEVLSTTSDGSVGKVVPGFKRGIIQEGDNVTTRFKVS